MEVKWLVDHLQLVVNLYCVFQTEEETRHLPPASMHGLARSVLGYLNRQLDTVGISQKLCVSINMS